VLAVERTGFALVVLLAADLPDGTTLSDFRPSAEVNDVAWADLHDVSRLSRTNARLLRKAQVR